MFFILRGDIPILPVREMKNAAAAIFDVDGTLVRADVVDYYLFLVSAALLSRGQKIRRYLAAFTKAPYWFVLDRFDRAKFNRNFYRSYRGLSGQQMAELREACFKEVQASRLIHETVRELEEHRNRGDKIVLVSGSLDFLLDPLARHLRADACLCPSLVEEEGSFSGELKGAPVIGEEKARLVRRYAQEHGLDLSESYAYADSVSDLPLLELVGRPIAVHPDRRLRKHAKKGGWRILDGSASLS